MLIGGRHLPGLIHRTSPAGALLFHDWESITSVYDRRTGQTHFLSALPTEILRALEHHRQSSGDLAQILSANYDIEDDSLWRNLIDDSLSQLRTLDLIEFSPTTR